MNGHTIDVEAAWRRMQDRIGNEMPGEAWSTLANGAVEGRPAEERPVRLGAGVADAEEARHTERAAERGAAVSRRLPATNGRCRRSVVGWTSVVASACVLALLLSTPFGGAVWASVMDKLRFQHFAVVEEADLAAVADALRGSGLSTEVLDLRQYGVIEYAGRAEARRMTAAEAAALTGRPVLLPPDLDPERATVVYEPQWRMTFQLNVKPINKLIDRLGGTSRLPDTLDGERVTLHMPARVRWEERSEAPESGMTLIQTAQPQLEADASADFDAVRRALLDLPFLTDNIRDHLELAQDWRQTGTLPLPIPKGDDASVASLRLNGHEAILTSSDRRKSIVWLRDGFLYRLSGTGATFPEDDDLIERAKELARP